jgi:bacillithiol synthase
VKSECLPFTQIPHTTKLFEDFLSYAPAVQSFYPRSPHFREWIQQETPTQRYDAGRRHQVSDILRRQNQAWGASAKTLQNVERLRHGACAAVTGQQVGLFGGPLFSIFKALTAVKLADEATAAGVDCVPVFWLATEDHDLEEINHTIIPGSEGQLENFTTSTEGPPGAPVGKIQVGDDVVPLVEAAAGLLGDSPVSQLLRESYGSGELLGSSFARLFAALFADWGVILLDALDADLHAIAEPIYRSALERAADLDDLLLKRGTELEAAGYHQQVKVTPSSTLLFTLREGARTPIHRRLNGNSELEFVVDDERIPREKLLAEVTASPDRFSPNVLLRPVVQDYLLPTLVYTGGAAEVAYFAQAAVVYQELLGHVTPVTPRFSATLVEPKPQRLLDRYELKLTDFFSGSLRELLASRALPADLQTAFDKANASVEASLAEIRRALEKLDPTLVDAANRAGSKMQYQLEHLLAGAARAELRQSELLARHSEVLSNSLFPNKTLQEREIAGVYFLARYGRELMQQLYETIHTDCLDHQVIRL